MASAIGTALISTILPPMAANAMAICKYIADKAVDKAVDKVMDKPMDKAIDWVVGKVDGIVNIERDISKLQTTLYIIQAIVQEAEKKQIDDVFIQNWLRDLVDIGYEARDVLEDFIVYSSCIRVESSSRLVITISSQISFFWRYFGGLSSDISELPLNVLNQLEKDIRSVREKFDEKIKNCETFATLKSVVGGGSESVREYRRPLVGPSINKQRDGLFLGREEVKQGIMEKILEPKYDCVDVVVIWGMGGIGKTTLAQSIYNDERVKIVPRRWSCVGVNKFSAEKVIREIVNDKKTIGIEDLQTKLEDKLRGDRFLIVLDDVWDVDGSEWDLLFNPLTNVGKGLIIITRSERELCAEITIQTAYNLEPLSEEDSWSIFESCAYKDGKSDSTPDLKGIGEEIVKKLKGHPLALKVVGRSLLSKDYSTWTNFLESNEWMLRKEDDVMSALIWSYNHLPSHIKTCFTYCALFPKDHVLDKKVLVEMWMAHDLIQKEKQKRPEDVGAQYFEELVNASLLQCVDGKHVMHDLIHDLALLVSTGEIATVNGSLSVDQMVRHITLTHCDYSKIPRLCKIEKLLTLYTTGNKKYTTENFDHSVLDYVFKQLKSIRVLVLSRERIYEIPDCISELKHLRYLDVSKTDVRRLPDSLCHLYNLQMLAAPRHAVLPHRAVNMVNLRYIRASLSTCEGVGKLTSLQELSSIHVCRGDNIRELGDMPKLRGKLTIKGLGNVTSSKNASGALFEKQTHMDKLILKFDKEFAKPTISKEVLDALVRPPNLRYLKIYDYTGVKPPSWMSTKLQKLKLLDCPKLESLPPLGELTSLKRLSLWEVGVKRLGDEFYGKFTDGKLFFPSLESLSLENMNEWEEWGDIIIENSSMSFFPRLTTLEIYRCRKLASVLPVVKNSIMNAANFMTSLSRLKISCCDRLKRLQLDALVSLKELEIYDCRSLVQITSAICECLKISLCESLVKIDVARCGSPVAIKILELKSCDSLTSLSIDIHGLDSLEHLDIIYCPKLKSLPPLGEMTSLQHLYLEKVGVKRLGDEFYGKFTDGKVFFPSLEWLRFCKMEEWEEWDDIIIENSNVSFFPRLTTLKIYRCRKLVSVLPVVNNSTTNAANFMTSLSRLEISECPQLQSLPAGLPPSLRDLTIRGCPLLYERCKDESAPDWHKINHICARDIRQYSSGIGITFERNYHGEKSTANFLL